MTIVKEIMSLLKCEKALYDDIDYKQKLLSGYCDSCASSLSGETVEIAIKDIVDDLREKADWQKDFLRRQEWINGEQGEGWFNSYYDDNGKAVERYAVNDEDVRMMLTGQVFAVMSGTADDEQVGKISRAADHYLYRKEIGGYRLNTDFHELKMDMGRMFGFSYGEKENGAVFSHMSVMYGNALYTRGFAKEGYKVLQALADTSLDFATSRMYPGIPEYFNIDGRGMYPYLTGAASWYMMTMILEVFGVRGGNGDLVLRPRLLSSQFDDEGVARIELTFSGKPFSITYHNPDKLDYEKYEIKSLTVNGGEAQQIGAKEAVIKALDIQDTDALRNNIDVRLG